MPSTTPPFLWTVLGIFLAGFLAFLFNLTLNRLTKKQDRRQEWYDAIDKQCDELTDRLHVLSQRIEILEMKVGPFWRYLEDHVPDMLRPPPPPPSRPRR